MTEKGRGKKESAIGFYILDDCEDKLGDVIFFFDNGFFEMKEKQRLYTWAWVRCFSIQHKQKLKYTAED